MPSLNIQDKMEIDLIPRTLRRRVSKVYKSYLDKHGDVFQAQEDALNDGEFALMDDAQYEKVKTYLSMVSRWASQSYYAKLAKQAIRRTLRA